MVRRGWWRFGVVVVGLLVPCLAPGCGGRAQIGVDSAASESAGGSPVAGSGPGTVRGTGETSSASAGSAASADTVIDAGIASDAGTATDAGTVSASDDAKRCAAALNRGQAPTSCELSCSATNGCCGGGGYCDSTNTWTYYAPVCFATPTTTECAVPAPTSSISGMSPLGPITLQYAWAAETSGFSHYMQVFFTGSPTARLCEGTSLGFMIYADEAPTVSYVGQRDAVALLAVNGSYAYGAASIQILSKGAEGTRGKLSITGPGWDVSGDFSAPDCPALDSFDDGK